MNFSGFLLPLLENASMLMALVVVYHAISSRFGTQRKWVGQTLCGVSIGLICLGLMLVPLEYAPGVFFDTRSVLLGLSGLFFGLLPTALAAGLTILFRYLISGPGVWQGIATILVASGIGLAWRHYRWPRMDKTDWRELYVFGLVLSLAILPLFLTLPVESPRTLTIAIALPILLVFPASTLLVGYLLLSLWRRNRLMAALRKHMALLRLALSASRQVLFDVDLPEGTVTVNIEREGRPGHQRRELHLGISSCLERIHPDDRGRVEARYLECRDGLGTNFRTEFRLQMKDGGEWRWVLAAGRRARRGSDGPPHLLGTLTDITPNKRKEEKLRIFRELVDHVHDSIEVYDPDSGRILDVNRSTCESLGYSREELLGMTVFDLDPTIDPATYPLGLQVLRQGKPLTWQGIHRRKDGTTFPVEVSLKYVSLDREYVVAAIRDITERKRVEQALQEESARRRLLVENSRDGIVVLQADGRVYEANRKFAEMLGYTPEEAQQLRVWDWDYQWSREELLEIMANVDEAGDHFETRHRRKDGSIIDVEISNNAAAVGDTKLIFCVIRDISGRKQSEDALRLAALVYQNSREAMMVTDADANIIDINPRFTKVTGYARDEVIGRNPRILQSNLQSQDFYDQMWRELSNNGHWEGEIWNRRKGGEVYPEWLSINAVYNHKNEVYRWVAQFTDITDKKNAEQLIWRQANFDALTGLPNRRMFNDRLEQDVKKAHRHDDKLALLFLDLDHFKEVNDSLGHELGDQLLQETARRLQQCVRETDTISRLGGDEFVIILTELEETAHVGDLAQSVLWRLAEPFDLRGEQVYVSTSIGITLYPDDAEDADDLLKKADQAMYDAKKKGRNRYQYFTPQMQQAVSRRLRIANDLRSAIRGGQLTVHYQPIVELPGGTVRKAEALLRWHHPVEGYISPADFIPIAEDTGLINDIGEWVFEQVAARLGRWRRFRPDFQVSINKSPVQFRGNVARSWIDTLRQTGIPGQHMVVEITESLLLDANTAVHDQLLAYRDAGVQVALDDFGTGYSSLAYLKKFDIDYLKIDRSFVDNLAPDNEDMVLCTAIITMAHRLGLEVIAEGVETAEQRDLLRRAGCDFAQGYLFARPGPAEELEALLTRDRPEGLPEALPCDAQTGRASSDHG